MFPGRNDPCWCGSGQKFRRCHLNRERAVPMSAEEALNQHRAAWSKKYCLHPEAGQKACRGGIARAHTISKKASLQRIGDGGHVCQLSVTIPPRRGLHCVPSLQRVGLNEASTFTGFCARHDNETFGPIDRNYFLSNSQHAFLVGYRAICRELFGKTIYAEKTTPSLRELDRGRSLGTQIALQTQITHFQKEVDAGLRELTRHKKAFDRVLTSGDFRPAKFYVVRLISCPEIMCCGAIFPEREFEGKLLQDFANNLSAPMDCLSYSIFGTDLGGVAVFAWVGEVNATCSRFVGSLHAQRDNDIPNALVRFTFEFFDNTYFSEAWWNGLGSEARANLVRRADTGTPGIRPLHSVDALKEDGVNFVSWQVTARETNATW